MVTLGVIYSFGVFLDEMTTEFGTGKGETAVVFGITTCLLFWLSLITGKLVDRVGPRMVLLLGAISLSGGLWATSLVTSLTVGYVTYGIGAGVAAACGYIPLVASLSGWFERGRALAVGIAAAGIGVGGMVITPLSAHLVDTYGWRDTYRFFAVVGGAILLLCVLAVGRPPGVAGRVRGVWRRALRSRFYWRLWLGAQCSGLALFIPFVFLVQYAQERGVSSVAAASLLGLLGGSSIVSRVGFGALTNRLGAFVLYRFGIFLYPVSFLIWLLAGHSTLMLVAFSVVLGIGYGSFVAISPLVLAERFGTAGLGSLMGLFYTTQGLGALIGPPATGWVHDATGSYTIPLVAALVLSCAAVVFLIGLRAHAPEPPLATPA